MSLRFLNPFGSSWGGAVLEDVWTVVDDMAHALLLLYTRTSTGITSLRFRKFYSATKNAASNNHFSRQKARDIVINRLFATKSLEGTFHFSGPQTHKPRRTALSIRILFGSRGCYSINDADAFLWPDKLCFATWLKASLQSLLSSSSHFQKRPLLMS